MMSKPGAKTTIKLSEIQWDTEERHHLTNLQIHLRETTAYIPVALWSAMTEAWGMVPAIKTATNVETGDVTLFKADPKDEGAVPVRIVGAQTAAEFTFWRPLQKLNLKIPRTRQFNVPIADRQLEGGGTVFVARMTEKTSVLRNLKEEQTAPATPAAPAATAAPASPAAGGPAAPAAPGAATPAAPASAPSPGTSPAGSPNAVAAAEAPAQTIHNKTGQ